MNNGHKYHDVNKYVDTVLDAAENILGVFGFNRKDLGFQSKNKNFFEELLLDREQEILADLQSLGD